MQHRVQEMMRLMASKIGAISFALSDDEIEKFIGEIMGAQRIYVMGAGRSGLVAKAFAMRMMHLGFQAYVVGETITPALRQGDLMVIFSGSGRTKTVADIAETRYRCLISPPLRTRLEFGKIADTIVIIGLSRRGR
jgi:6-phospho-3-hexuloisomerase